MSQIRKRLRNALAILLISTTLPAQAEWDFLIEPYLNLVTITGDADMGRATGVPIDVDFGTILDHLEIAGMIHFEAQHDSGWGLWLDYGFMDLGFDSGNDRGGIVDAGLRQGIFEAVVVRQIEVPEGAFQLYAGVRWWDNDVEVDLDPAILPGSTSVEIESDWVDPVVGFRWQHPMADSWTFNFRGDIGGFGAGSDFTWKLFSTVAYQPGDNWMFEFGYVGLGVDYEDGSEGSPDRFSYETITHGPFIGVGYHF